MSSQDSLAREALREYSLRRPRLAFIRHNENLTYQVTDGETGDRYVLRVHRPAEGVSRDTPQHSLEELQAELEFIQAIREHTDIAVQRPVATLAGGLVGTLTGGGAGAALHATLLTWIEGRPMSHEDPAWEHQAYQTGVITARLHGFSEQWSPRHVLRRRRYDQAMLTEKVRAIGAGVELGLLTSAQYRTVQEGAGRIGFLMDQLDRRPGSSGLIHADLQRSNLIVNGDSVTPIDFALSGYGHFLQDLGGLSADFAPLSIRQAMLAGYRTVRALPDSDMEYIEAFFVSGILLFMATHLHNPRVHEWFGRRTPAICREYITPLLEGRRFYESI